MTYDLLIKNGRVIDGSGRPAYHGDVGVAKGKIVERWAEVNLLGLTEQLRATAAPPSSDQVEAPPNNEYLDSSVKP